MEFASQNESGRRRKSANSVTLADAYRASQPCWYEAHRVKWVATKRATPCPSLRVTPPTWSYG